MAIVTLPVGATTSVWRSFSRPRTRCPAQLTTAPLPRVNDGRVGSTIPFAWTCLARRVSTHTRRGTRSGGRGRGKAKQVRTEEVGREAPILNPDQFEAAFAEVATQKRTKAEKTQQGSKESQQAREREAKDPKIQSWLPAQTGASDDPRASTGKESSSLARKPSTPTARHEKRQLDKLQARPDLPVQRLRTPTGSAVLVEATGTTKETDAGMERITTSASSDPKIDSLPCSAQRIQSAASNKCEAERPTNKTCASTPANTASEVEPAYGSTIPSRHTRPASYESSVSLSVEHVWPRVWVQQIESPVSSELTSAAVDGRSSTSTQFRKICSVYEADSPDRATMSAHPVNAILGRAEETSDRGQQPIPNRRDMQSEGAASPSPPITSATLISEQATGGQDQAEKTPHRAQPKSFWANEVWTDDDFFFRSFVRVGADDVSPKAPLPQDLVKHIAFRKKSRRRNKRHI